MTNIALVVEKCAKECFNYMKNRNTRTRAIILLPPFFLLLFLGWVIYAHYLLLIYRTKFLSDEIFTTILIAVIVHVLWILDVWCLIVIETRGPGFVMRSRGRPPQGLLRRALTEEELGQMDAYIEDGVEQPLLLEGTLNVRGHDNFGPMVDTLTGHHDEGSQELEQEQGPLDSTTPIFQQSIMAKSDGKSRFCRKCQVPKPDRAHHCRVCQICSLKMDHHCVWLGTCLGIQNYKMFVQWLIYSSLLSPACAISTGISLASGVSTNLDNFDSIPISCVVLLILGGVLSLILPAFTVYHLYLVSRNRTTIENIETSASRLQLRKHENNEDDQIREEEGVRNIWIPDSNLTRKQKLQLSKYNIYDLGVEENFKLVFGRRFLEWVLPIGRPSCDGYVWPVNQRTLEELETVTTQMRTRNLNEQQLV